MTDEPKGGRFFVVKAKVDGTRCLVEAHTISAALRRAAAHYCEAYPAKAAEIVELMKDGCEVIEIPSGTQLEIDAVDPEYQPTEDIETAIARFESEGKTI